MAPSYPACIIWLRGHLNDYRTHRREKSWKAAMERVDEAKDEILRLRAIETEHAAMKGRPVLAVQVVCKGNVCVHGHWDIDNVTPGMRADWLAQGMKIIKLVAQEPT